MKKLIVVIMMFISINSFAAVCNTTSIFGIEQCEEVKAMELYGETIATAALIAFFETFKQ